MKTFTVCCTIRGVMRNLLITTKITHIAQYFVYDGRKWLCTLNKGIDGKYNIISSGSFRLSTTELESLSIQIDYIEQMGLETV